MPDYEYQKRRTIEAFMRLTGYDFDKASKIFNDQSNKKEETKMDKPNFPTRIHAIKALRELTKVQNAPRIEKNSDGEYVVRFDTNYIGLKEAKDLVEACMMLGVREFLRDSQNFYDVIGNPFLNLDIKKSGPQF